MDPIIRIWIASPDAGTRTRYTQLLHELSFTDVGQVNPGTEYLNSLADERPEVVFLDESPDETTTMRLAADFQQQLPAAVVILLRNPKPDPLPECIDNLIFGHIVKGSNEKWRVREMMGRYAASRNYSLQLDKPGMSNTAYMRLIADVQEDIRKSISAELHDNVNQLLGASKLYIESAMHDGANRNELLTASNQFIVTAISEIRKISHHLSAADTGVKTFSRSLAEFFMFLKNQSRFTLEEDIDAVSIEQHLSPEQQHHVLRILQELVNNAIKYADASVISLSAALSNQQLLLTISDNGKGFDDTKQQTGMGISNAMDRVTKMYGDCMLTTADNKGCTWKITIPLNDNLVSRYGDVKA